MILHRHILVMAFAAVLAAGSTASAQGLLGGLGDVLSVDSSSSAATKVNVAGGSGGGGVSVGLTDNDAPLITLGSNDAASAGVNLGGTNLLSGSGGVLGLDTGSGGGYVVNLTDDNGELISTASTGGQQSVNVNLGGTDGLLEILDGGGGPVVPVNLPIDPSVNGKGGTGGAIDISALSYLAQLIASGDCGTLAGVRNVTLVEVEAMLPRSARANLGSVLATNAGAIAGCQSELARIAAVLQIDERVLRRIVAVDIQGSTALLYMV